MERSLIRRHFFLAGAIGFLVLLVLAGGIKLALGGPKTSPGGGPGGPPGMAQGKGPGAGGGFGGGAGGPGGRGAPVTLVAASNRDFADRIDVLGVAKGRQSVTLTSATTELVTRVLFRDGQYVQRGQVLVELQANEQSADLAQALARLAQANADYDRWSALAQQGVAPRATAEQYKAALATARAAVAAAQARVGDRVIRAPFSGVVGLTDIAPGALINPGTAIATLDDVSVVRVDFDVPDRYLPVIQPGMAIVAKPDSYPGMTVQGQIAQLDTRIDERTRAITARALFPNYTGKLKPGMLMRVGIEQSRRTGVSVPEPAVQFEGDAAFVFVAKRGPRGLTAEKRQVTIGLVQDGFIEVRSGLAEGEQVVADGLNRIQPGQPLMPAGPRPSGAGAPAAGGRPGGAPSAGGPPQAAR